MQRISLAFFALIVSTLCACSANTPAPAAATASATPAAPVSTAELEKQIIDLEKRSWEVAKNKQVEEAKRLFAPGYRAVYLGGIRDAEESIKDLDLIEIKQYSLSDIKVSFPIKDTAILTYKLASETVYQGKNLKNPLYCSAVWVNIGGEWKSALYTESPATPAK